MTQNDNPGNPYTVDPIRVGRWPFDGVGGRVMFGGIEVTRYDTLAQAERVALHSNVAYRIGFANGRLYQLKELNKILENRVNTANVDNSPKA